MKVKVAVVWNIIGNLLVRCMCNGNVISKC